jgi:hypothetical protein
MKRYRYRIDSDENGHGYIAAVWDEAVFQHLPFTGYLDELPADVQSRYDRYRLIDGSWVKIEDDGAAE